ncbi:carbohydrate binding family 9 domain-containing protein [Seonamhaeicola maritimus]|uniref:carbohydrate binding family 9 domain-containing protein n=1 Tax=Seonamhaeicola maritimus TaxID=2591822 RepID=UPI0024943B5E|nr:carbohydrate binding family 9 domain-containing protein [Seonamhaeicola maritimus]
MFLDLGLYAQGKSMELSDYQLQIAKSTDLMEVDGVLEENSWKNADIASDFWMQFPSDNTKAQARTEIRMTYDDKNVYIGVICYDVDKYVVQTLRRDSNFFEGDAIGVVIDPVNNQSNGFLFGVSPYNVQVEELLRANTESRNRMRFSWDNRWFSEVTRYEDHYVVEIAIPFRTLRFKSDIKEWGINFFRNDLARNQYHSWTPLPVNFELYDLGYTGNLVWDQSPAKTGTNISAIPYTTSSAYKDNEQPGAVRETSFQTGVDAKIAVTSSLNLDLTLNPDFSQVDVDQQQTNLTRYSLRFPERRGFFLENSDLYTFGFSPNQPIFTRRIGLDENRLPVPITYGIRLGGNLNSDFRIGLMHLQTEAKEDNLGQNYSIAVFDHRLFSRSSLRGYATNRQAHSQSEGRLKDDYGRNSGLAFNYMNTSGTLKGRASMHISDKPEFGLGTFSILDLEYVDRKWNLRSNYWKITSDYFADMGFIPRLDNYDAENDTTVHLGWERLHVKFGRFIRPKGNGPIVLHDVLIRNDLDFYPGGVLGDRETRMEYNIRFRNTSTLRIKPQNFETNLIFATEFTNGEPLPVGNYNYSRLDVKYESDNRKALSLGAETSLGTYYNGSLNRFMLELRYRRQPWGQFLFALEQNYLMLPEPYGKSVLSLISAKSDMSFSTKFFWTSVLQYNTQQDNFNINSRLQWRYKTMSDIFLVYTDNYATSPFLRVNKNRAVLLKINYMLNI